MRCKHTNKLLTVVIIPDYNGMGTELALQQCDYCKAFVIILSESCNASLSVRTFETVGWSTKK